MMKAILILCLGFYVFVKGADGFVESTVSLACFFMDCIFYICVKKEVKT